MWAASLATRLGPEGWSTWGVYAITALLQGTLLVMAVYFEYISPSPRELGNVDENREAVQDGDIADDSNVPDEDTPLLHSA